MNSFLAHRRFLSDNPVLYTKAIEAAQSYVSKLEDGDIGWLHSKPFDPTPGNPQYFRLMFDLLNILQAMQVPARARILEVGSGPGWVTEILLMLGFSVDALEPSADLIAIAQERCTLLASHYRLAGQPNVRFHQSTLEKSEFEEQSFDAILFFDVLHHVVDEDVAIEKVFHFLKPGGRLGIVDPSWHPDYKNLETQMMGEMAKFGTLENPFSTEYIDHLLNKSGFVEIQRYLSVNGMFPEQQLSQPLRNFSPRPFEGSNNMTARKPDDLDLGYPSCTDFDFKTNTKITLLSGGIDPASRSALLAINLENTGETLLDNRTAQTGHITLALRSGAPGTKSFTECRERHVLAEKLIPGKSVKMELFYTLPPNVALENWELDVVSEGAFWFSSRAIQSCPIPCL